MTWEIAFTVVGSLWALVVVYSIRTERQRELEKDVAWCKQKAIDQEREVEFLKAAWRVLVNPKKESP